MLATLSAILLALAGPSPAPGALEQTAAEPTAARSLFVVIYRPGPAWIAGKPMRQQKLGGHLAHIQQLFDAGQVFAGGGFTDSGVEGGMAILWAASLDQANGLVDADPAIRGGVFVATVRAWTPRFDSKRPLAP